MRVLRLAALIALAQVCVVVILFSFAYSIAHATTIYSTIGTDSQHMQHTVDPSDTSRVMQPLGTGLSNTGGTIIVHFKGDAAATGARTLLVIGHWASQSAFVADGSQFGSPSMTLDQNISPDQAANSSGADFTQTFTYTVAFNPSLFYVVEIIGDNGSNYGATLYGSTSVFAPAPVRAMNALCANFGMSCPKNYPLQSVYIDFTDAGGYTPPPPSDTTTRIVPLTPTAAGNLSTTTGSTTVVFSANYLFNASTTIAGTYNELDLFLRESDSLAASSSVYALSPILAYPAHSTLNTMTNTITLPSGSAWVYNWCWGIAAPWGEISGDCSPSQSVFVITNPIITALGTTTTALGAFATSTCSITNVTGCVQNAIGFLFWPSQDDFNAFGQITGNIRTHVPFGYVYILLGQVQGLSASTTPAFSITVDSNIQSAYFDPIKAGIATILWALAAMWFFVRIRDLHL